MRPWHVVVIVVLVGLVYLPSLKHDFVWEEHTLIAENRDLDAPTPLVLFGQSFTHAWAVQGLGPHSYYRPLPMASFWLEKTLWGAKPMGFHLTNVVLNAVAGVLVALLFMELLGSLWTALLASLAFALQAAHVESVAFIVGRTDILMTFFLLSASLALLRYRKQLNPGWLALTIAAYMLALLSKEAAILFPVLAAFVLRPKRKDWALWGGLVLVAAGFLAVRALVLKSPGASWGLVNATQRVFLVLNAFGRSVVFTLLPFFHRVRYGDLLGFVRFGWPTTAALAAFVALFWFAVKGLSRKSSGLQPVTWPLDHWTTVHRRSMVRAVPAAGLQLLSARAFVLFGAAAVRALDWRHAAAVRGRTGDGADRRRAPDSGSGGAGLRRGDGPVGRLVASGLAE
jgi:hypothetical protein